MRTIHIVGGIVVLLAAGAVWARFELARPRLPKVGVVPEFTLTERSGRTVSNRDLEGTVWLASFLYTRCPGPCPAMAASLRALERSLDRWEDVRMVTFSIDPERDTPEVLSRYARTQGIEGERWMFLTGTEEEIDRIATQGFMLSLIRPPGAEIVHGTRIALVDRRGGIRGFYEGISGEPDARILRDIARVRRERTNP